VREASSASRLDAYSGSDTARRYLDVLGDVAAAVVTREVTGRGESGPLCPVGGRLVHGADRGDDARPVVSIARWAARHETLDEQAPVVAPAVVGENRLRDDDGGLVQVLQQIELPAKGIRGTAGRAND
jgi:hypothetical protein